MSKRLELTGKRFGRLRVVGFDSVRNGRTCWKCICDCGEEKIALGKTLKNKGTESCGCFGREERLKANTTHGMKRTRLYSIWQNMKTRCENENTRSYKHYGRRGIHVCNRWLKFEKFRDDMYESYLEHVEEFGEKNTSIERRNNNLGYSGKNCCWATILEQANNRRNNIKK